MTNNILFLCTQKIHFLTVNPHNIGISSNNILTLTAYSYKTHLFYDSIGSIVEKLYLCVVAQFLFCLMQGVCNYVHLRVWLHLWARSPLIDDVSTLNAKQRFTLQWPIFCISWWCGISVTVTLIINIE